VIPASFHRNQPYPGAGITDPGYKEPQRIATIFKININMLPRSQLKLAFHF
jgi:hypothetical protein